MKLWLVRHAQPLIEAGICYDRAYKRADKLRAELGWGPGIIHAPGGKPKGMHWRTFWRLHARYNTSVLQALGGASVRIGKVMTGLKHLERRMAQK